MAQRRKLPNGTGSIERVLYTPQGKRRVNQYRARAYKTRKDLGFFKTYNQALEALLHYKGTDTTTVPTFKEMYEQYKSTQSYKKLSPKVQGRYDTQFSEFEELHDIPLNEIVYSQLQKIIDDKEERGYYKRNKKGEMQHHKYSYSQLKLLKILVSKVYKQALRDGYIQTDLSNLLIIGGVKKKRVKEIFTKQEIDQLTASIPHNPNARHVLVMTFTGMRTGEYLGLKSNHIDFDKNTITDFGIKTEEGIERKLFIHPTIKDTLSELVNESSSGYIIEQNSQAIKYDKYFYDEIYYPALKAAGVKEKIPYTCRYTFATIAHNSGVDDKALQKLMGHVDFNVTANSYIQDLDDFIFTELQKI